MPTTPGETNRSIMDSRLLINGIIDEDAESITALLNVMDEKEAKLSLMTLAYMAVDTARFLCNQYAPGLYRGNEAEMLKIVLKTDQEM